MVSLSEIVAVRARETGRRVFARSDVLADAWYVASSEKALPMGRLRSIDLGRRRIAVWRGKSGAVHAMDARCPHLGADLSTGKVTGEAVQCPFHHWCFRGDGRCVEAPGQTHVPDRRGRAFSTAERFGLVWLWSGEGEPGPLPSSPWGDDDRFRALRPPSQRLRCHAHLILANGLDATHFEALHDMISSAPPRLEEHGPGRMTLRLEGRPRSRFLRLLTGTGRRPFVARFTTEGPSVAWASVESPSPCHVLFTARPLAESEAETQTILFLPRSLPRALTSLVRFASLFGRLLRQDRQVLEGLDFHRGFTSADEPLARFASHLDAWPASEEEP